MLWFGLGLHNLLTLAGQIEILRALVRHTDGRVVRLEVEFALRLEHDLLKLVAVDVLLLHEHVGDGVEDIDVYLDQVLGAAVRGGDQSLDFFVDHRGGGGGVVRSAADVVSKEGLSATRLDSDLTDALGETHLFNHHTRRAGDLLEVTGGAGGNVLGAE